MYIKQLEVDNFKSFANEVNIPFLKGFTTISGPNGSGKSNIIDSILFALGLSSSRALRAEKLFHLISTHTKRNEAYVKVTFDLEEENEPDLTIARRIKKTPSGFNSIYYLNDKICTLTQVHTKLEQYNITPNSYNVMMQGDVTSITACSSSDRRKIIDEIAGVADFDRRIEQAQNELETVEQRVEKSILILNEVNVRLEELKVEREQALKYKELKDEKTKLESQIDTVKYFDVKKSLNMVHENILEFEKKKADETKKLSNLLKELEEKQKEFEEISKLVKEKGEFEQLEVKKQVEELKGVLDRKNSAIIFVDKNIQDNLKTVENAKNGIVVLNNKINDTKNKINEKLSEIEKIKENIETKKIELNKILEELTGLNDSADEHIQKRVALRKELEELKDKELNLQKEKLPLENDLTNTKNKIQQSKEILEKLSQNDTESNKDRLKVQIDELEKELGDYKIAQQNTLNDLDKTKNEMNDLAYNIRIATSKVAQMEGAKQAYEAANYGGAIDVIMNSNIKGVHAPLAKLAQVDKEYSLALEVAMGNRMRNIVVDDDYVAKSAIEILKSTNSGRVTFLPLNKLRPAPNSLKLPKDSGVIDFAINLIEFDDEYLDAFYLALGETLIVEDYQCAQKLIGKYKMVTLNGEVFDKSGAITGGSTNNRSGLKFSQTENEELDKYRERLKQIEQKYKNTETKKLALEEKLDKIRSEYSNITTELSKAKIEYQSIVQNSELNLKQLEDNKKILFELEPNVPILEKKLDKLEEQEFDLNEKILKLNEEIEIIESSMTESQLGELKTKTQDVENQIKTLENNVLKSQNDINDFNRDINFNVEVIKTKEIQIEKLHKDNEILKQDKIKYENEIVEIKKQIEQLNIKIEELAKDLNEYQQKRDEKELVIREITKNKDNLENSIERVKEQIESFKSRRRELEPVEEELRNKLKEVNIDVAKIEPPQYTIDEVNGKINKLSRQMEAMEPINMLSITSYDEVSTRKEELQTRIDTLSSERKEILERMSSYEKLKKDTFLQTYNKINENFKDVFNKLSDGEGTLILENHENPFAGGLTIEAQPRDKKKQRLELMSGGEKSLTALAFVFAIQRYMPSPFYAFDEVDMHLDGINVEKLSEMIQLQSKDTQFIVVSLRKPMIESANRTIGVTQKDKGITKVTGVKLRD